jgi:DNA-binding NtrC family response regulator
MINRNCEGVHALIFGLTDDLAGELLKPLQPFCQQVQSAKEGDSCLRNPDVIFCGADRKVVTRLRSANPDASIVVVSRHPEVSDWLDSIEAGATDYCAAPFDSSQVQWILQSSRLLQPRA